MNTAQIKCLLIEKNLKMVDLEVQYGLRRGVISLCLITPHKKAEKVLSKALSIPAYELFPERYDKNGRRYEPQPAGNYHYKKTLFISEKSVSKESFSIKNNQDSFERN